MTDCSECGSTFSKRVVDGRQSWRCESCKRVLVGFAVLKQTHQQLVTRLHYRSSKYNRMSPHHCVACGTPWQRIYEEAYRGYFEICKICQWAWLPSDFEQKFGREEVKNWNDPDSFMQVERSNCELINKVYRGVGPEQAQAQLRTLLAITKNKHSITRRFFLAPFRQRGGTYDDLFRYLGMLLQAGAFIGLGYYAFYQVALL